MEKSFTPTAGNRAKAYFLLTKPGIIMGNAITAIGGFSLAARGHFEMGLFCATLVGLCLIVASACAFNNYIDRYADQKMLRTQNRPLARGIISPRNALAFATALLFLSTFILVTFVNLLTAGIALVGFCTYVFLYSFLKYRSTHATLVGSIAGAIPPTAGYCAASNHFDGGALLLFIIIALWQMPHFFAIAIYRMQEYASAHIPVLPLKKGIPRTKIHMLFYIIAFGISCLMLTVYGYTGIVYGITVAILGLIWLGLSIQGFRTKNDTLWARKMFLFSLIAVTTFCAVLPNTT
jgi:protoheme IX farnesyltransferase